MKKNSIYINVEGKQRRLVYVNDPDKTEEVFFSTPRDMDVKNYRVYRIIAVSHYLRNKGLYAMGIPTHEMIDSFYDEYFTFINTMDVGDEIIEEIKLATTIGTHGLYRYGRNPK